MRCEHDAMPLEIWIEKIVFPGIFADPNGVFSCDNKNHPQVVAGLLVPIYIKKLDFKTREELQQMPQTEEEHLENQYMDYEDKEKSITDAEVKRIFFSSFSLRS